MESFLIGAVAMFQVFSSQATDALQELIFKLSITDAISNLNYKIDFLHKVAVALKALE
jgi:hypothetical protein